MVWFNIAPGIVSHLASSWLVWLWSAHVSLLAALLAGAGGWLRTLNCMFHLNLQTWQHYSSAFQLTPSCAALSC
jgi:hypothetical protein